MRELRLAREAWADYLHDKYGDQDGRYHEIIAGCEDNEMFIVGYVTALKEMDSGND